jgi:alpha-glucoside transport system substrate-binding protein
MHGTRKIGLVAGTLVATVAIAFGNLGAMAQDAPAGLPSVPTGYAELDQALGADKPFNGKRVTLQNQWIEGEGVNFRASLLPFEQATGIDVAVAEVPSGMHETQVNVTILGGAPADLIQLAQPAVIQQYGAEGHLVDLATVMDVEKLAAEHPATLPLYSAGDQVWGMPYKVDVKSVVWYPIKAFEAKGYQVPTTWEELIALSDRIVADGDSPWCVGIEASAATGWIITDWIEDVMLRTAGVEKYNQWAALELPFSSPEVKRAFDLVGQMLFTPGYVIGGNTAILATWQGDAMDPMWDANGTLDDPSCWMQKQATWYGPDFFPDAKASPDKQSKFVVGEDIGLFYFPPIDEAMGNPALGSGDAFIMTNDRPEVRAVLQYLAVPEGIKAWIDAGSAVSANQSTPADWYQGYKLEVASGIVANATSFGFDASDLMPASGAAFWAGTIDWIQNNGENTDAVLAAIDEGMK